MRYVQKKRAIVAIFVVVVSVLIASSALFGERYRQKVREDLLRQDLFAMRSVADQYVMDKGNRPRSLDDLVTAGYLKEVTADPMTGRNDTWVYVDGTIHSGSQRRSSRGTPYSSW
jgi:general secretion pathway protein G